MKVLAVAAGFQPWDGPSRGLLCDYKPLCGPSFEALVTILHYPTCSQISRLVWDQHPQLLSRSSPPSPWSRNNPLKIPNLQLMREYVLVPGNVPPDHQGVEDGGQLQQYQRHEQWGVSVMVSGETWNMPPITSPWWPIAMDGRNAQMCTFSTKINCW